MGGDYKTPLKNPEARQTWNRQYRKLHPKLDKKWWDNLKLNPERYQKKLKQNREKGKRLWQERRKLAFSLVGQSCFYCNDNQKLHLHHLWYEIDSPRGSSGAQATKRVKEAITHPERFRTVCFFCHRIITLINSLKDGQRKVLAVLKIEYKDKVIFLD